MYDFLGIEVDLLYLTDEQKQLLKDSWKIIYSNMGNNLCYVGQDSNKDVGVADTFLRLFEEYPQVSLAGKTFVNNSFYTESVNVQLDKVP